MVYEIEFTYNAEKDLKYFAKNERQIIIKAIIKHLRTDAEIETKKKKQLRLNPIAPWELKIGDYRVFYKIEKERVVIIAAVGCKTHNDLYIRGKRVII